MKKPRFRHLFLLGGAVVVLAALFATDPDHGITTGMLLLSLVTPLLAVGFVHLARKALHDYPEADARNLFRRASEDPVGSGLALVALAIVAYGLMGLFGNAARAADIPANARAVLPALSAEIRTNWPDHPYRAYFGGLGEQESCITLRHPRCWSPQSRLKTAREEGAGIFQITRAYNANGSLRFDALAEMRAKHPSLREWSWHNVYQRTDLQLRAAVLKVLDDYGRLGTVREPMERLAFADAAYNGGLGGVQKERRACQIKPGCDPQRWFGHVEMTCMKSRAPLYGNRSACDINREHVVNALRVRSAKYAGMI